MNIKENIAISAIESLNATSEIAQAAEVVGLGGLIKSLPQEYETPLGKEFNGTELSGGQWQKIAIARAIFKNVPLLILDEPTASLDPRSEYELFSHLHDLARSRTTIIITHRLVSAKLADRILVLKDGRLIENGSHAELISLDGEYASLWQMQSSKYLQDQLSSQ